MVVKYLMLIQYPMNKCMYILSRLHKLLSRLFCTKHINYNQPKTTNIIPKTHFYSWYEFHICISYRREKTNSLNRKLNVSEIFVPTGQFIGRYVIIFAETVKVCDITRSSNHLLDGSWKCSRYQTIPVETLVPSIHN